MGSLRIIFAISVVFAHTGVHALVGARNAVQIFFIISGFLISYVLVESENYKNIKNFYLNRFLRLYPIYFITILFILILYIPLNYKVFSIIELVPIGAKIILILCFLATYSMS